ncbi:MAG: hypothetical protein DWQ07_17680 [Chloroflexi bacterium]|nr:MAG: hypothetical protein DWQ07_17680 [Chloroflexota bacterium]
MIEADYGDLLQQRGEMWAASLKKALDRLSHNRWNGPMEKLARDMEEAQQDYLFSTDGLQHLLENFPEFADELRDGWAVGEQIETCERLGIDLWQYIADDVQFWMEDLYRELDQATNDIEAAQTLHLVNKDMQDFWGNLSQAAWQSGQHILGERYQQMGIALAIQPQKWNTEFEYYGIAAEEVLGLCDWCLYPLTGEFLNVTEPDDLSLCVCCNQEFNLRDSILLFLHATGRLLETPESYLSAKNRWVLWPAEYK